VIVVMISSMAVAEEASAEDFESFFARFASDSAFRESRIELPLPSIRGNPTDPRIKAKWSIEDIRKNFTPPAPTTGLEAQGLEQQLTFHRSEMTVQQSERDSDSYIRIYRFRLKYGQWWLTSYEDSSY